MDILEHTLLSAHNPDSGRYDALRLAELLAVTPKQMAAIVGYTPAGVRKNPDSEKLQGRLEHLTGLVTRLKGQLDGNLSYVKIWLKAPHPALENQSPLAAMEAGHLDAVEALVTMMETGQSQ